jgi:hypothetical protein
VLHKTLTLGIYKLKVEKNRTYYAASPILSAMFVELDDEWDTFIDVT